MSENYDFGKKGEEIAQTFLKQKGYSILATNWHHRHKEVDIIAEKDNSLIIVEVKSRSNTIHELPQDAVTKKKQRFLIEAANAYVEKNDVDLEVQFDIITVVKHNDKYKVRHIKDAFYPIVK
ncbi:MAG: YraN family protein [Bacteroidales bacterium]|nr:YraN family protein [Bacteroidales bacterium]